MATEEEIKLAYKTLRKYAKHYRYSDDDIQNAIMKFTRYYDSEQGSSIEYFILNIIKQNKITEFNKNKTSKHKVSRLNLDSVINEDDEVNNKVESMIATNDELEMIVDEQKQLLITLLSESVDKLPPKQKTIITELYFNEMSSKSVMEKYGWTYNQVMESKRLAMIKLKKMLPKACLLRFL